MKLIWKVAKNNWNLITKLSKVERPNGKFNSCYCQFSSANIEILGWMALQEIAFDFIRFRCFLQVCFNLITPYLLKCLHIWFLLIIIWFPFSKGRLYQKMKKSQNNLCEIAVSKLFCGQDSFSKRKILQKCLGLKANLTTLHDSNALLSETLFHGCSQNLL